MWAHRSPVHVRPAKNAVFAENRSKFATFQGRTEASAPTYSVLASRVTDYFDMLNRRKRVSFPAVRLLV